MPKFASQAYFSRTTFPILKIFTFSNSSIPFLSNLRLFCRGPMIIQTVLSSELYSYNSNFLALHFFPLTQNLVFLSHFCKDFYFYTRGLIVDPAELFEKRENAPRISLRDVIRMTSGKAFSLFQPSCLAEKLLFSIKWSHLSTQYENFVIKISVEG
jgi:hypothetical protein